MTDSFSNHADGPGAPARRCFAITPSDTVEIPFTTKAIRAGGNGAICFRAIDSATDVVHPVLEGERIDVRVTHIRATGTTVAVLGYA